MPITNQHKQEDLGQAYVRAVIAKAGFNLSSDNHDYGYDGTVKDVVNTKVEGKSRAVTLHLSPENHTLACDAYRDDKEVEVSGVIDKSGKYWFFSEVNSFQVIE